MRLDKLIEEQLHTPRKTMKRLFQTGHVYVDGKIERRPERNVDHALHRIVVQGKQLQTDDVYFLLNKPAGVVTANHDQQHPTVIDCLATADQRSDLYAVGRLDRDTEGLVLLTSNGQLGYALMHPEKAVTKCYDVIVNGCLTKTDQAAFAAGVVFHDGTTCLPAKLTILSAQEKRSQAIVQITEGKFHQVKKMFLSRGVKVIGLKRTAIGPLTLPKDLATGHYRTLTQKELESLVEYFH